MRQTQVKIISERRYGQQKLKKPKELKGIKQLFSVSLCTKGKGQVFIKDNDAYLKINDWFSSYKSITFEKSKFVYNDAYGAEVYRNEAWVKLEDVMLDSRLFITARNDIVRQVELLCGFDFLELFSTPFSRMIENILQELRKN